MEQNQTKNTEIGMGTPKVSVIIPVYNAREYLVQCVGSVLAQTLPDVEILCVDDGSLDNSLEILRRFEREHSNIRVFATENLGVSHARNLALDHAAGEYVAFLDSDDYYYCSGALEALYNAAVAHGVSVCGGLRVCDTDGMISPHSLYRKLIEKHPQGAKVRYRDYQEDYHFHNCIYRREMIESEHLRFPNYRRYEDPVFFAGAMVAAEEFYVIPDEVYCYRRKGKMLSLTPAATLDTIRAITENLKLSSEHSLAKLHYTCVQRLNKEYCASILEAAGSGERQAVMDALERANAAQDYSLIQLENPDYGHDTMLRPLRIIRQNRPLALQAEKRLSIGRKIKDVGIGYAVKVALRKLTRR